MYLMVLVLYGAAGTDWNMLQVCFPFLFLSLPGFLGDCCGLLGGEGGGVDEKMGMGRPEPKCSGGMVEDFRIGSDPGVV